MNAEVQSKMATWITAAPKVWRKNGIHGIIAAHAGVSLTCIKDIAADKHSIRQETEERMLSAAAKVKLEMQRQIALIDEIQLAAAAKALQPPEVVET